MVKNTTEEVKDFFLSSLPPKLKSALEAYNHFSSQKAPEDIKSFGAFHLACKNALSHVLYLMKILQSIDLSVENKEQIDWLNKATSALELEENDHEE